MTGLCNRHRFEEEMAAHGARVHRHGGSTTLIVIDLDGLKRVNDQLGHAAGDELIRGVSQAITSRLRTTDVAGRLGGDEFGVLLLESTPEGAMKVAHDLLAAIRAGGPEAGGTGAWSTASIGIAYSAALADEDGQALLAEADEAMYAAKRAGGDRVAHAGFWTADEAEAAGRARRATTDRPAAQNAGGR